MLSPREPSTSASVGEHTLPLASCALGAAQPCEPAAAIACAAPLMLADAQGYFADQNITVSLCKYAGWTGRYSR